MFINGLKEILINDDFIHNIINLKDRLDYDKEVDKVCIIVDRDKQSFKTHQYKQVIDICKESVI